MFRHVALLLGVLVCSVGVLHAASNDFTIGLTVTSDVTAPSVPTGLAASAVSSSQINLSWTASTDNIAVGGYAVHRNGTAIATTTGTSYSDTGLSASTQYSYFIRAFDTSNNYSAFTSTVYATTTAATPGGGGGGGDTTPPAVSALSPANGASGVSATATLQITFSELINKLSGTVTIRKSSDGSVHDTISIAGGSVTIVGTVATIVPAVPLVSNTGYYVEVSSGSFADSSSNAFTGISGSATWAFTTADTAPPVISSVVASSTYTTATITFLTNEGAQSVLAWGTTTDYALGSQSELTYGTSHSMSLASLVASTTYYFKITATDPAGNTSVYTGTFATLATPPPIDTTPPANPAALAAVPAFTSIALSWNNPGDVDFAAVRLMRSTTGYPSDHTSGALVYEGAGSNFTDTGRSENTLYYYSLFARDASNNYSSGAIVATRTLSTVPPPPPPPPTPTPAPSPSPTPGGSPSPSPEPPPSGGGSVLPPPIATSTNPLLTGTGTPNEVIGRIDLGNFHFVQPNEPRIEIGEPGGVVRVHGDKNLEVYIPRDRVPYENVQIAMTVGDPGAPGKTFSVLLRPTPRGDTYTTTIGPLRRNATFPFVITVTDPVTGGVRRIDGNLDVRMPILPDVSVAETVKRVVEVVKAPVDVVAPVAVPVGIAVGAGQAVLLGANVGSLYDAYLVSLKFLGLLTGLFRRRKSVPWGIVYDSVTKRPIDPAYVVAQSPVGKKVFGEAITDLDGRYGFMLTPGEYVIVANKTHYKFPSERLRGEERDEFYENLYFGEAFHIREGSIIKYNIPLDPVKFDWNEFAKDRDHVYKIFSKREHLRLVVFNALFFGGMFFSGLTYALYPTFFNAVVLIVYLAIFAFQIFWKRTHHLTQVLDRVTQKPIAYALVKVWIAGVNTVVRKAVTDEFGRFYMLVPPGKYIVTVERKLADGSYKEVYRTPERDIRAGVIRDDIVVVD